MNGKESMTPRDTYQAYLKGDLSPAQVEQAVQSWYSAFSASMNAKPPKKD